MSVKFCVPGPGDRCLARLLDSHLTGHFFAAAILCCGGNGHCAPLDAFDDTVLSHSRNFLIAAGPSEGFVVGVGRSHCHFERGGLSCFHREFSLIDRQFGDRLFHRDLAGRLDSASVFGRRGDRSGSLRNALDDTIL